MSTDTTNKIDRRPFVADLLSEVPDALVVTGLGSPSYDVCAAGARARNFYLWGAMGAATPLGLGLALAQPEKSVVVITGDGEQLMGIGALGSIAVQSPPNLTIVVLDNGHFGETGMQPSHSSLGTDLCAVAKGFGIDTTVKIDSQNGYAQIAEHVRARRGTTFAQVLISNAEAPRVLPPRDGTHVKNTFRAELGLSTF
jgi:thiamine pyrophosphate-dependent acetolactate synthase large subunit-like protein